MKEKIFILVKTYPTISSTYDELVCTAGIRENGDWVRIYPIPFRKLEWERRYKKYQWINVSLKKNHSDPRPESFSPQREIELLDTVGTTNKWAERRQIISSVPINSDMDLLIKRAHDNKLSLAMFKPTKIKDFIVEETEREWSHNKIRILKNKAKQVCLFQSSEDVIKEFSLVKKLPYKFSYIFSDENGKESKMMVEDWEIGSLFWNCLRKAKDECQALQKVRDKMMNKLLTCDLHFILGTTRRFHGWARNPFIIVGIYYPPHLSSTLL